MLVAEDIGLSFADAGRAAFTVLDVPRFAPAPGRVTAIAGPSGSGKSTLLYVLAGLLRPQRGRVMHDGQDIYALSEGRRDAWRRHRVGIVFQDFHLIPELSAVANVALAATFGPAPDLAPGRAAKLLADLGVPVSRGSVELLSRGERQRVAIARALLFDPPVILADEPTASLDALAAESLIATLRRLASEGRTVLVASHDRAVLDAGDSVFTLRHGRLAEAAAVAA
ncbi:MAG: ATP-binding cassette domain-containing protein [Bauldia sp.]|nr:ATP-binding cassette domain-containing protein [Bauldia sp.]